MSEDFNKIIEEMIQDGYFEDMTSTEGALRLQKALKDLKADRDYYKEMYYKIAFPEEEIRIKGLGVD